MTAPFSLFSSPPVSQVPAPSDRFGTVTSLTPLRVTLDGPLEGQQGATPVTLARGLALGDRVQVLIHHGQMVITGRVGGDRPVQRWGSANATWANLGLSSASRVLATVDIPAAPYPRYIDVDGILVYQSQAVGSTVGQINARVAASVDRSTVTTAQVRIPIFQTQYTNHWKAQPIAYRGHLLPANTAATARLWHWNENNLPYTWQYDRGANGETSQIYVTATPA
jgi:hypothetical protein